FAPRPSELNVTILCTRDASWRNTGIGYVSGLCALSAICRYAYGKRSEIYTEYGCLKPGERCEMLSLGQIICWLCYSLLMICSLFPIQTKTRECSDVPAFQSFRLASR
ncbi:unnamed protein product, partial [Mycena citricolor]